jgi:hypothetical protein
MGWLWRPSMGDPLCELANVTCGSKTKKPRPVSQKTRDKDGAPGRHAQRQFSAFTRPLFRFPRHLRIEMEVSMIRVGL